jgi:carboxylesterase
VAVIGFSTGATLALNLAASKPVERMVLLAPFLEIRFTWMMPVRPETLLRPLARLLPHLPRRGPAMRDRTARDSVAGQDRFRTFNLHASISALDLIEKVKPIINSITVPTLILQGKHDSVVEPRGAEWVYRNLGSTHKELIICTKSDHLVALDHDRDEVLARTMEFLLKPLPAHQA